MKEFVSYSTIWGLLSSFTQKVYAEDVVPFYTFTPPSYLPKYEERYTILNNFFSLSLSLISITAIGFLVWGGIQYITSAGEKTGVQAARSRITYAILGLILSFLAFFIVKLIGYFFALDPLNI